VGYEGEIVFDASKPDGTMKKLLDVGLLRSLGWTYQMGLEKGLRHAYCGFVS
jgi:GDP-L-fucose synthase